MLPGTMNAFSLETTSTTASGAAAAAAASPPATEINKRMKAFEDVATESIQELAFLREVQYEAAQALKKKEQATQASQQATQAKQQATQAKQLATQAKQQATKEYDDAHQKVIDANAAAKQKLAALINNLQNALQD